jgi:hypothetical protein
MQIKRQFHLRSQIPPDYKRILLRHRQTQGKKLKTAYHEYSDPT